MEKFWIGIVVLQEYGRKWFVIREMHYGRAWVCTVLGGFEGCALLWWWGLGRQARGQALLLPGLGLFKVGGVFPGCEVQVGNVRRGREIEGGRCLARLRNCGKGV